MACVRPPVRPRLAPPGFIKRGVRSMLNVRVRHLAWHLLFLFFVIAVFFLYPVANVGFLSGIIVGFLTWSLYVLCVPAFHGQHLFGSLFGFLGIKPRRTEPYMLLGAIALNVVAYFLLRPLYRETFFTQLLLRFISKPNPYWLMMGISSVGTLYYYFVEHRYVAVHTRYHFMIRSFLVLMGMGSFFYFAWCDLVMLLNHWI